MGSFESSNNQVVVQKVVKDPTARQSNRNMNIPVVDNKPLLSDTLNVRNTKNDLFTNAENEKSSVTQTETSIYTDASKTKLLELATDDVEPSSISDNVAALRIDIAAEDDKEDVIRSTDDDISQVEGTIIDKPTNAIGESTVDTLKSRDTESKDSLIIAMQQYRTYEPKTKLAEEFIKELIALAKDWVQLAASTISNDPVMISLYNNVKDSFRIIEISVQVVNDRLPSDAQPFVKGFLVGTLILNVFNEGQRYKEDVYTMYADENVTSTIVSNETDFVVSESWTMSDEADVTAAQSWTEEIETVNASKALDEETKSVVGEVQALAEVLISKRIVKELLQKKKEKEKLYFASSIIATSKEQNIPFPQPPIEKPPMELFDSNVRALVDIIRETNNNGAIEDGRSAGIDMPIPSAASSKRWTAPFRRNSARESKDSKDVPVEVKSNGFISWMKNIAESLGQQTPEKTLDSKFDELSPVKPSLFQSKIFGSTDSKENSLIPESWAERQKSDFTNDDSSDYDFVAPSKVDKIFDFGEFSYGTASAVDEVSGLSGQIDDFVQDIPFTSIPSNRNTESVTESFGTFNRSPILFNNEPQGFDQPENKTDERIAPFNIPIYDNSVKTDPSGPSTVKRTSYSSASKGYVKKDEPKAVEFNSPFDTYESQYARFGGSSPGFDNAGNAPINPPSKFEFTPPIEYKATFSALNIYSSESTPELDSRKEDLANIKPPNNYENPEQIPIRNSEKEEPNTFEFPAPPEVEPTFSALNIYGDLSTERPPDPNSSVEPTLRSQEFVEPTFSALSIYSVAPESNDVAKVFNAETMYSSVDSPPSNDLSEVYGNEIFENQETNSEPSFNLADLFNETTTSTITDTDKNFETQKAVNIPISDVLPPNFQVDIEVADSSQTNQYDKVSMFSILPDMNDIFSAKPSYNPYPTRQPEILDFNDLRNDAIDTPIDTNPTYPDNSDSLFMLPQEASNPPDSKDSSNSDRSFFDRETVTPEVAQEMHVVLSHGEATQDALDVQTDTTILNYSEKDVTLAVASQEVVPSSSSIESTKADIPSSEQADANSRIELTTDSLTDANLSYADQVDSMVQPPEENLPKPEIPSTRQSYESLDEKVTEQDRNIQQSVDKPSEAMMSGVDNLDSSVTSPHRETSSQSHFKGSKPPVDYSSPSQSSDDIISNESLHDDTATDLKANNLDKSIHDGPTIRDSVVVTPAEPTTTDIPIIPQNSETFNDNDSMWDDEPFQ